jgi:hypothetical protein
LRGNNWRCCWNILQLLYKPRPWPHGRSAAL